MNKFIERNYTFFYDCNFVPVESQLKCMPNAFCADEKVDVVVICDERIIVDIVIKGKKRGTFFVFRNQAKRE